MFERVSVSPRRDRHAEHGPIEPVDRASSADLMMDAASGTSTVAMSGRDRRESEALADLRIPSLSPEDRPAFLSYRWRSSTTAGGGDHQLGCRTSYANQVRKHIPAANFDEGPRITFVESAALRLRSYTSYEWMLDLYMRTRPDGCRYRAYSDPAWSSILAVLESGSLPCCLFVTGGP